MVNAHIPGYSELLVTVRECAYNMNFDKTKFDASSGIRYSAQQCRNSVVSGIGQNRIVGHV